MNRMSVDMPPRILSLLLFFSSSLIFLPACGEQGKPEPYPVVTLPADADTSSPVWKGIDLTPKPPVLPLSAAEQQATFQLPPGYRMTPVLTDPQIQQPGAITFDGQGRLLVLELRSYMLTADADDELQPISVISRWEDQDGDGKYETGGIFVDSLVFPRFVLPWGPNSVLTMESNEDDIYQFTDTDQDGIADKKEFFTGDFGRSGNVEHQQAFLFYGMDNWLYSTVNAFRIRWTPKGILRENTGFNRAQWGVTQDNYGKLWFQGGASGIPSYFQFPIYYGTFNVDDQLAPGFKVPWGAPMGLEDFQPGMRVVRKPDGSVNEVTGAAGNDVFRGHRLPANMVGQYFYGEPVARIVRQINPIVEEGITTLHNYYQDYKSEFIKSTDPLFRPVDMATAPDGTMYIADMYHGIIQEGQWVQPGSYLRAKIEQYQLDKVVSLGRIWRLSYEGIERDQTIPRMDEAETQDLVSHLSHPNGWWRDMAQQTLVLRGDQSVVPDLLKLVHQGDELARIHALWCLEGLDTLTVELVRELMADPNHEIRKMAIRASETLFKGGATELSEDYLRLLTDPHFEVVTQAMMTVNILELSESEKYIRRAMQAYPQRSVQVVGKEILNPKERPGYFAIRSEYSEADQALIKDGARIYQELCSTCHGVDGGGIATPDGLMAPPLINSSRIIDHPDYLVRVLLRGMVGPIAGKTYSGAFMAPMGDESDQWIAAVASYVRTNLGNDATVLHEQQVATVRTATEGDKPYTYDQIMQSATRELTPADDWTITASHTGLARVGGTGQPAAAFSFEGWTTGIPQEKDMWFQIEVPAQVSFTELSFQSRPIHPPRGSNELPRQTAPQSYKIEVSTDGQNWSDPILEGDCQESFNHLVFPPTKGKFLRITQTAAPGHEAPWRMESLKIFAKGLGVET